MSVHLLV